ncbi:MAG: phosphatidylserine decarboxylase, partial [Muribaculaceae bacterium]|nr:phosphatidylserine decarboxylase [Muribaculaceae bacterium]
MRVRLHHEGRNILAVSFLILLAINLFVWLVLRAAPAVPITVTVLSAIIFLLIVNFFRSPKRNFTGDRKNVVVASADGTVVALEEVFEDEYLHKNVIQLSIFMTILNVHANWFPVDGEVIYTAHH